MSGEITISDTDQGEKYSLSFSQREFKDFVLSLVSSPQHSSRQFVRGFDLTKESLKVFLDKVEHYLVTNYHVVPTDSKLTVFFEDGTETSFSNTSQFFSVDKGHTSDANKILISNSFLVPFQRDGKKSLEKQQIVMSFVGADIGRLKVEISSTEISWPDGVFNLIGNEFRSLSTKSGGGQWQSCPSVFMIARFFATKDDAASERLVEMRPETGVFSHSVEGFFQRIGFPVIGGSIAPLFAVGMFLAVATESFVRKAHLFDPKQAIAIESAISPGLVNAESWRSTAQDLFLTETLIGAGIERSSNGFFRLALDAIQALPSATIALFGLVFLYIFLNLEAYRHYSTKAVGRIEISASSLPPRSSSKKIVLSVFGALYLGVLCNATFGIFLSIFASIGRV